MLKRLLILNRESLDQLHTIANSANTSKIEMLKALIYWTYYLPHSRWNEILEVYRSRNELRVSRNECDAEDCKQANQCQAESTRSCPAYPAAPTYPTATPRHLRTKID